MGNPLTLSSATPRSADSWVRVSFPLFDFDGGRTRRGTVPAKTIETPSGVLQVATVFDLMVAHLGVPRSEEKEHPEDYGRDYDDPKPYTPAWQEAITGVPRQDAIRVAREFAENAAKTRGKSMIFLGAGTNHWYHSDMIYRSIINLTTLCGCQGVNGGGWAHYVGQEKVRPQAAWSQVAFGLDWSRPPRQQNGTSFYYFATDQWRYDSLRPADILSPLAGAHTSRHMADYNVIAARLGWLPSYPQFNRNPLDLCREAAAQGSSSDEEIISQSREATENRRTAVCSGRPGQPGQFSPGIVPLACQPAGGERQGPRVLS